MKCSTCKHWKPLEAWKHNFEGGDAGNCARGASSGGCPTDVESLVYADDRESYIAELVTRPDFGCVMWESRDAAVEQDLSGTHARE